MRWSPWSRCSLLSRDCGCPGLLFHFSPWIDSYSLLELYRTRWMELCCTRDAASPLWTNLFETLCVCTQHLMTRMWPGWWEARVSAEDASAASQSLRDRAQCMNWTIERYWACRSGALLGYAPILIHGRDGCTSAVRIAGCMQVTLFDGMWGLLA